jgi:hypothetical protein
MGDGKKWGDEFVWEVFLNWREYLLIHALCAMTRVSGVRMAFPGTCCRKTPFRDHFSIFLVFYAGIGGYKKTGIRNF